MRAVRIPLAWLVLAFCGLVQVHVLQPARLPAEDVAGASTQAAEPRPALDIQLSKTLLEPAAVCQATVDVLLDSEFAGKKLTIIQETVRVRDGQRFAGRTVEIQANGAAFVAPLEYAVHGASEPGVYEFRCRLEIESDKFWKRVRRKRESIAIAAVPYVVAANLSGSNRSITWSELTKVRPSDGRPWPIEQWLPESSARLLPDAPPLTFAGIEQLSDLSTVSYHGQTVTSIKPGKSFDLILPAGHPAKMHRIELRYPAKLESKLSLQVIDSKSGEILRTPVVIVEDRPVGTATSQQWRRFAVDHFPSRRSETLRLTNMRADIPASFDSITVSLAAVIVAPSSTPVENRTSALTVTGANWVNELTADVVRDGTLNDYGESTRTLHRSFLAATRLGELAMACGFNALSVEVPLDSATQTLLERLAAHQSLRLTDIPASLETDTVPNDIDTWPTNRLNSPDRISVLQAHRMAEQASTRSTGDLSKCLNGTSLRTQHLFRDFGQLPMAEQKRIASSDPANKTAVVSLYAHGNKTIAQVTNLAPWDARMILSFGADVPQHRWIDSLSNLDRASETTVAGNRIQFRLGAGEMAVLESDDLSNVITDWTSQPADGVKAVQEIKEQVTQVVQRLGMLAEMKDYSVLINPDFETSGEVGLPGWLHSQHPADSVQIDTVEAAVGKRSIRIENALPMTSPAWLVSEPFPSPSTGRLAVSMLVRGESNKAEATHKLRIAVEGIQAGEPYRQSSEINVPATGQWQEKQVLLEASGFDTNLEGGLRLAIDSLSPGKIWVDDIRLYDEFPLKKERDALQNLSFLAVQGLQRGDFTPASRLLTKYWARYLLSQDEPAVKQSSKPRHAPGSSESTTPRSESEPDIATGIRSWLPQALRF